MIKTESVVNFLAFMIWNKTSLISINELNSIILEDNESKDISFFKYEISKIIDNEINLYNLKDWENIWLLLSGWLDSTLLLNLLINKFPNSKIYTYTLWYKNDDKHLEIAKNISKHYNTIHREIIFDLDISLLNILDEIYQNWYDLEWEDSLIMNHILSKEVKKDCKVVFSWFWLDYIFAWMDLFRNSFNEKLYNQWLINKKYILDSVNWNKYYFKYILDKISNYEDDFFIKYWEYYGNILLPDLEKEAIDYFSNNYNSLQNNLSDLKKQIYYIIHTSLSNRYNPYNKPYEKLWIKHFNPFWSKNVINKFLSLNIDEKYLYNPYTKEKKYIIKEIAKEIIDENILNNLHSGTVLKYDFAIKYNKNWILDLINEKKDFLSNYLKKDFLDNIDKDIEDSMWYENSKKIIILLQFLYYIKNNKD